MNDHLSDMNDHLSDINDHLSDHSSTLLAEKAKKIKLEDLMSFKTKKQGSIVKRNIYMVKKSS